MTEPDTSGSGSTPSSMRVYCPDCDGQRVRVEPRLYVGQRTGEGTSLLMTVKCRTCRGTGGWTM